MTALVLIALLSTVALGPALFWLWYFYNKDLYEPEPIALVLKLFLLGAVISAPIWVGETALGFLFSSFIITSLVFLSPRK